MSFKVGDRVKVTKPVLASEKFLMGKLATVIELDNGEIFIRFDNSEYNGGSYINWEPSELSLVEKEPKMKQGTIIAYRVFDEKTASLGHYYATVVSDVEETTLVVCVLTGPDKGKITQMAASEVAPVESLPESSREARLEKTLRLSKLAFMGYQAGHIQKRGPDCEKAIANGILVELINEALRP